MQVNNHNLIDEWEQTNQMPSLTARFCGNEPPHEFSRQEEEEEVQVPRSLRAPRAVPAAEVRTRWRRRSRSGSRGAIAERARARPRKRSAGGGPAGGLQRRMGRKGRLPLERRRPSNRREPLLLLVEQTDSRIWTFGVKRVYSFCYYRPLQ